MERFQLEREGMMLACRNLASEVISDMTNSILEKLSQRSDFGKKIINELELRSVAIDTTEMFLEIERQEKAATGKWKR